MSLEPIARIFARGAAAELRANIKGLQRLVKIEPEHMGSGLKRAILLLERRLAVVMKDVKK